ncbi:hypothetical protein WR25_24070 isoform E [Diploscapter pachys]|uniref:Protein kinase domain-containing protein n=1 Tax=Diploscapter pachys TaxID=2018661 RepID=A0A2A2J347_9BILA|nr:hypothetical protein WR25_24070 isoform D [Diploscapter pachys]PAV56111.1 hypothetical protein WR25_24070 isoform E [Diploscapter pachys]
MLDKRSIVHNFSVYDFITGSNKIFTADSGMLLIHLPEQPVHSKHEYSIRTNLFISIAKEDIQPTPDIVLLDIPQLGTKNSVPCELNSSIYDNGVIFHMISPGFTNYDDVSLKIISMDIVENLTILNSCSITTKTVLQKYYTEDPVYIEIRGRCFSLFMPYNNSAINFTVIRNTGTIDPGYSSKFFFTSQSYPVIFQNDNFKPWDGEKELRAFVKMSNDEKFYTINFTVTYADFATLETCIYFIFLHTVDGGNKNITQCGPTNNTIIGNAVAQGFQIETYFPYNSSGLLLRLAMDKYNDENVTPTAEPLKLDSLKKDPINYSERINLLHHQESRRKPNMISKTNLDSSICTSTKTTTEKPSTVTKKERDSEKLTITLAVTIPIACIIIIAIIACTYFYYKTRYIPFIMSMKKGFRQNHFRSPAGTAIYDPWVIKVKDIEINEDRPLGKGAFSEVFEGTLNGDIPLFQINQNMEVQLLSTSTEHINQVAVKRLLGHASDRDRDDFMKEIEIMKALGYNTHIVSMFGYVASKFIPLMIMEFCESGDLLNYVKKNEERFRSEPSGVKELTSYAWQISDGMSYIASKDIIHRDLAARNVLLTRSKIAKIGDFGLSIRSDEQINAVTVQRGLLPVKWAAPETFGAAEFSTKSDVWSYGVTLWETYSLGEVPYKDVMSLDLQNHLKDGNRLEKPDLCSDQLYGLMLKCWSLEPGDRLTFEEIKSELTNLVLLLTETYGYIDIPSLSNNNLS